MLQTNKIITFVCLSFLFSIFNASISSALVDVCSSGQLFNVMTGTPCPGVGTIGSIMHPSAEDTSSCLEIQSTKLLYGMNDAQTEGEISKLQAFLKDNGYLSPSIATTGSFGLKTKDAVKALQRDVLNGVLATDIDSAKITSAEDRQTLASTGFLLSNTGTVGLYTKAKIAFLSCGGDIADTIVSSSQGVNTNIPSGVSVSTTAPNQSTCSLWSTTKVYLKDNCVTYNGSTYTAKWWTQGDTPNNDQWAVWSLKTTGTIVNSIPTVPVQVTENTTISRSSLDGPVTCTVPTYIPNTLTNSSAASNGTCEVTLTWPASDKVTTKVLRWQMGVNGSWMGNVAMTDSSLSSLSRTFTLSSSPVTVAIASNGTSLITKTISGVCANGAVRNSARRCVNATESSSVTTVTGTDQNTQSSQMVIGTLTTDVVGRISYYCGDPSRNDFTSYSTPGGVVNIYKEPCKSEKGGKFWVSCPAGLISPVNASSPITIDEFNGRIISCVTAASAVTSPTVSLSFDKTLIGQSESAVLTYNFSTPDVSAQSTMLCNVHFYDIATNSTQAKNSTYGNQQRTEVVRASDYPKGLTVDAVCKSFGSQEVRATRGLSVTPSSQSSYCPDGTARPSYSFGGGSTGCENHMGAAGSYVAPDSTPVFTSSNFANGPYVAYSLMVNNAYIYSYLPLYTRTSGLVKSKNPKGCMQKMGSSVCSSGSYSSPSFRFFTENEWINGDTVQANIEDISSFEGGTYEAYIVYPTGGVIKSGSLNLVKPSVSSSNSRTGSFVKDGTVNNKSFVYFHIEGIDRTNPPQGCMQPIGAESCQRGGASRSFNDPSTDTWLDHQILEVVMLDYKIYPLNTYELWINYPGFRGVKVGTVTLRDGGVSLNSSKGVVLGSTASNVFCLDLSSNLHRGAESENVMKLQTFLSQKGFLTEAPSGFYGDKTVEAVKDYQTSKGLPQTGMVYDITRSLLKEDACKWKTVNN